jgi:hypothetical protein
MKGPQQLRSYVELRDYTTNEFRVTQPLRFGMVCGFAKCFNLRRVVFAKTAEKNTVQDFQYDGWKNANFRWGEKSWLMMVGPWNKSEFPEQSRLRDRSGASIALEVTAINYIIHYGTVPPKHRSTKHLHPVLTLMSGVTLLLRLHTFMAWAWAN